MWIGCVIPFKMYFFSFVSTIVFGHVVVDFLLFLPVGDKVFQSDDSGTATWLLDLDRIFR